MENKELSKIRVSLLSLKLQLTEAVGSAQSEYWTRVSEFLKGQMDREDLGTFLDIYLPKDKIHLHNEFINKSILAASLSVIDQPENNLNRGEKQSINTVIKRKLPGASLTREELENLGKEELKLIVKKLGKKERERLKNLNKGPIRENEQEAKPDFLLESKPFEYEGQLEYQQCIEAPLCIESKSFPTHSNLQARLTAIALEHGLEDGVDPAATEILLHALETHLQNIVTNCLDKVRSKRLKVSTNSKSCYQQSLDTIAKIKLSEDKSVLDVHLPETTLLDQKETYSPAKNTISSRDLLTTFSISPFLLVERPQTLERLITIHNPAYIEIEPEESINYSSSSLLPPKNPL